MQPGKLLSMRLIQWRAATIGLGIISSGRCGRMKAKGGNKYAILSTANKLARIYYKMVTQKLPFIPVEITAYQQQRQQKQIAFLERKLERLRADSAA